MRHRVLINGVVKGAATVDLTTDGGDDIVPVNIKLLEGPTMAKRWPALLSGSTLSCASGHVPRIGNESRPAAVKATAGGVAAAKGCLRQ